MFRTGKWMPSMGGGDYPGHARDGQSRGILWVFTVVSEADLAYLWRIG